MTARGTLNNAITLISATGLAQLVGLAALPFLTRLYTPEDFGLFAIYSSLLALATVVVCLRYEMALVLTKTKRIAGQVFRLCILATLFTCIVSLAVIFLAEDLLIESYGLDNETKWYWLIPISLLVGGFYKALIFWHTRERSYKKLAFAKVSQSVPQTIIQLGLGFSPLGVVALIIAEIAGKFFGSISLRNRQAAEQIKVSYHWGRIKKLAYIYRKFPLVSSWSMILNQLGLAAPALFLAAHYGAEVAGWYAISQRILAVPMDLIGQSISSLFIGEASNIKRNNPDHLKNLYLKFLIRMFLLGSLAVVVIFVSAEWLFITILGGEWAVAGTYAKVLVFGFWFRFAVSPLSQILNIIERQDLQLYWDVCRLILVVLGFALVVLFEIKPEMALIVYTVIVVMAQTAHAIITYSQLRRLRA